MAVSRAEVDRVSLLARLSFSDEEKEKLVHDLNDILKYMEQLNTLDTTNVEPLSHVVDLESSLRDDSVRPCLTQEEALRNAPSRSEKFFKVPKVIGDR